MAENINYTNIPQEKFTFASNEGRLHDKKLETKPIGYLKDAWLRFKKNKGSIIGACVVLFLVLFAIIGPYCYPKNYQEAYATDTHLRRYQYLPPKIPFMEGTGIWDGTKDREISEAQRLKFIAMAEEKNKETIVKIYDSYQIADPAYEGGYKLLHKAKIDQYAIIDTFTLTFTEEQWVEIQAWQDENEVQLILPWVDEKLVKTNFKDMNIWYHSDQYGNPLNAEGEITDNPDEFINIYLTRGTDMYESLRLEGDPGIEDPTASDRWRYAKVSGKKGALSYTVRVDAYNYFTYKYGFEPYFVFGSSANGWDVFTRLAGGARFSLLFALAVSAINLFIGAIYGAIEGYYGGKADLIMERISDILASIPSMVVTVLFNLHLSAKVGVVPALLYAFIMTGWIGMASRTRMQFYRFKNQEYVLAARTLGARDRRIMFKHIFPNSLGTLITSSVLVIPGVIYSETSLTYLGIINLDSPTRSSVGAMLSAGQSDFIAHPYLVLFPALFIGLLMISFNLFGNGLRDAFNPSLRGTEE